MWNTSFITNFIFLKKSNLKGEKEKNKISKMYTYLWKIFFKIKYFTPINFNKKYLFLIFLIKNYIKN